MHDRTLIFGADGGGTKTLGILADESGTERARMQVGPGNPNVAGVDAAATNLLDLVAGCCEIARCFPRDIGAAVFGLAGVGSLSVRQKLLDAVHDQCVRRGWSDFPTTIDTDARIAVEGAFGGGPGVVIIAGTGSMFIGKLPDGTLASVGGWGRVLGDEGSGYFLGLEAAKAVVREIDGRGHAAAFHALLKDRFGWETRDRIIAAVYQEKFDLASLAPVVIEAAAEGDATSRTILEHGAREIADALASLVRRMKSDEAVGVVFVGGLIDHDTVYARILLETIGARVPIAEVRPALYPPARGALILAKHIQSRR